jgi:hypothetical protein
MDKRPEYIRFVKIEIPNEEFEEFDKWLNKIEDTVGDEEDLAETIKECKEYYGERFSEIFDEEKLNMLHENHLDICLWELQTND